jgi:hypothetical protein
MNYARPALNTGTPRTIIDIEKAAKFSVRENRSEGPRLVKWRPLPQNAFERGGGSSQTSEEELAPSHRASRGKRNACSGFMCPSGALLLIGGACGVVASCSRAPCA